jgi:CTP synthase (UTP-ammonia lyase)
LEKHDMKRALIAVVGDFDPAKIAHQGVEQSFELARASSAPPVEPLWVATKDIVPGDEKAFGSFQGIWCVPGTPYVNMDGAFWTVTYARTRRKPFFGTCGGMQHALIEYARNVLGLKDADHAETNPGTSFPLLHRMKCSIIEKSQSVVVAPGTRFRDWYGADSGEEGFHCSYGLNPEYERLFQGGALEIAARSEDGEVRAVVLRGHPFFVGTLFQPERRALAGSLHPVVKAFLDACAAR